MAITYSISGGADAAKFNIDSSTGKLTFKTAPDFEAPGDANKDNIYEVKVRASDSAGAYTDQDIRVTVKDVADTNRPPQITSAAAVSVNENQTAVLTVTATDPDDGSQPPSGGTITLTPSGSITVGANNQVIENKLVTGSINVNGKSGVTIRNCQVNFPGGIGIEAWDCTNLTIQDCKVCNTNHPTGQREGYGEYKCIQLHGGGPYTLTRVYVEEAAGIYAYACTGKITVSFLEGHNIRGTQASLRGQLIQLNNCTGGLLMEDFSCECPANNSWTEDNINLYDSGGSVQIRRGLIDGNNSPSGCGMMFEGVNGALVEDVDCVHMGNGAFAVYSSGPASSAGTSANMTYRRCNTRDNIATDQGRGPPLSGGSSFNSSPGCTNTKFEQCLYWNVKEQGLSWDDATMTTRDLKKQEFTARAPIRNKYGWE